MYQESLNRTDILKIKGEIKMFWTYQKNNEQYFAKTWQQTLRRREIQRNNYRVTGDLKKAKAFVTMLSSFTFRPMNNHSSEHVIFSKDALAIPLGPTYVLANALG